MASLIALQTLSLRLIVRWALVVVYDLEHPALIHASEKVLPYTIDAIIWSHLGFIVISLTF